jgi:hypothetical protein
VIDRQHGTVVIGCDACDEVLDTEETDFAVAWPEARRVGWTARKMGNEWVHLCPGCKEEHTA